MHVVVNSIIYNVLVCPDFKVKGIMFVLSLKVKYKCISTLLVYFLAYHRTESNLRLMLMYNQRGHKVTVKPLSEEAAISLATDMMNDIFIFSIAFLVLYQEYIRSSKSSAAEKMQRENEILSINNQLDDLVLVTARHDTQLREAERERYHLLTMVSDLRTWSSSCTKLISEKQDSHLREVFRQIKHLQTIQLTVHKNSKTEHINIAVEKEKMD